jgi:hypothetical protein
MSAERIDVLAVMDAEIARCSHLPTAADLYVIERYHAMVDARAAVAELIESGARLEAITVMTGHPKDDAAVRRFRAALARVGGDA